MNESEVDLICQKCRRDVPANKQTVVLRRYEDARYDHFEIHCPKQCKVTRHLVLELPAAVTELLGRNCRMIKDSYPTPATLDSFAYHFAVPMPNSMREYISYHYSPLSRCAPI